MIVVFDNNMLSLLLHPDAEVPNDPATNRPVDRAADRLAYLIETLREAHARIVIPAPVLGEFLTYATPDYLTELHNSAHFEIVAFDERAAVEAAVALRRARRTLGKKLGLVASWQKIKIDRQVIAIAKVVGAEMLYTTDADMAVLAKESGITTQHLADLPLPPSNTPLLDTIEDKPPSAPESTVTPKRPAAGKRRKASTSKKP